MFGYIVLCLAFGAFILLAVWDAFQAHTHRVKQMELLDAQLSILLAYATKNDINI